MCCFSRTNEGAEPLPWGKSLGRCVGPAVVISGMGLLALGVCVLYAAANTGNMPRWMQPVLQGYSWVAKHVGSSPDLLGILSIGYGVGALLGGSFFSKYAYSATPPRTFGL